MERILDVRDFDIEVIYNLHRNYKEAREKFNDFFIEVSGILFYRMSGAEVDKIDLCNLAKKHKEQGLKKHISGDLYADNDVVVYYKESTYFKGIEKTIDNHLWRQPITGGFTIMFKKSVDGFFTLLHEKWFKAVDVLDNEYRADSIDARLVISKLRSNLIMRGEQEERIAKLLTLDNSSIRQKRGGVENE